MECSDVERALQDDETTPQEWELAEEHVKGCFWCQLKQQEQTCQEFGGMAA